jgi:AcrR family transcriptional regulator
LGVNLVSKRQSALVVEATVDERVRRSKAAVLDAAVTLLAESGLSGVSVDEVARRSGVAKTTIYRHWPSREALMLAACATLNTKSVAPDMGSLRDDLQALMRAVVPRLRSDTWASSLLSLLDAAERNPDLAALQINMHRDSMSGFRQVVERAQTRGELDPAANPSHVLATIIGPLLYRRFVSREPLDNAFVETIFARTMSWPTRSARRGSAKRSSKTSSRARQ